MKDYIKPRYGLEPEDVERITARWSQRIKRDSTFENLDAFLKWCSENGFQKGLHLRKIDQNKPFGPDNMYWYEPGKRLEQQEIKKPKEERTRISPPSGRRKDSESVRYLSC